MCLLLVFFELLFQLFIICLFLDIVILLFIVIIAAKNVCPLASLGSLHASVVSLTCLLVYELTSGLTTGISCG